MNDDEIIQVCIEHDWRFLREVYRSVDDLNRIAMDVFYCTKCLQKSTVTR